ncbi:MAG: serine/threonine-protein kinase [Holophaga sp.]|nr:serine/threonine-protein kinase [Holophaga sp.]
MLQIGDQFDHYQISAHIAQGGMSDIYRAYDFLSGKEVVLKIPNRASIGDPAQYERFQRELEVMRTLDHPAIQKGVGSGQFNATPYLVTRLITGQSMRELVQARAPMPAAEAVALIRRIADALAHCHDHEIIHRDIKPENILITPEGDPVILDFGLALTKQAYRVTYASLSGAAGTPDYMAPEQIEGHRGDKRTDVYAVGTMLFELLSGHLPFEGDNPMAVMALHLQGNVPRLDQGEPAIPAELAAVVARAMQRDPAQRCPDMHALMEDLDHPENVDLRILDRVAATAGKTPFWRSPILVSVLMGLVVLLVLVVIGFGLQALHK